MGTATTNSLQFHLLTNEFWWGGRTSDGVKLPFGERTNYKANLNDNGYNQAAPFFVSSKGRYLWSDEPFSIRVSRGQIICEGSAFIQLDEQNQTMREAFKSARRKLMPPPGVIPDPMLFRTPQYNTWIELMYDQEESAILEYASRLITEGYPPGVLMIDDNWQEDYGNWTFHGGRFKNPKSMIARLHDMGFKVMLWICPFISPDSFSFRKLKKQDALVLDHHGEPLISKWWNGYSGIVDLTIESGLNWFQHQLQVLIREYGIDGFKFDAGDLSYYPEDGHKHLEAFNRLGAKYPLNEFRAAWKCADLPLAQRLADRRHAWDESGLASVVPNMINQGMLGYPFSCPDMIGGGEYQSFLGEHFAVDQELVVRYAQVAALCPMMQFSAAPWRILDAKHAALCLEAARLHATFGDQIVLIANQSALTGEPMLRSMAYQFGATEYSQIRDQFMLGDSILVAPVLKKGQFSRPVVVPPGCWKDDQGAEYIGPQVVTIESPIERLIWMKRVH